MGYLVSKFASFRFHLYCYFHNVAADMSSGLLQVFVELETLHGTSNYVIYLTLMIKIIKIRLRNFDNKHLKKAGGHFGRNVVEITIKMKTIVRKLLMIKIINLHLRNLDKDFHLRIRWFAFNVLRHIKSIWFI